MSWLLKGGKSQAGLWLAIELPLTHARASPGRISFNCNFLAATHLLSSFGLRCVNGR